MKPSPLFTVIVLLLIATTGYPCGKERWAVKVGKDKTVKSLYVGAKLKTAIPTTIQALRSLPAPIKPGNIRTTTAESTIWIVEGVLTDYKEESGTGDHDYHLAIRNTAGNTMIAEIPDPQCLNQTPEPLRSLITKARAAFDAKFQTTGQFKKTNTKVRITGVGFFDKLHGQRGVAPNGIEVHPVLAIEFIQ